MCNSYYSYSNNSSYYSIEIISITIIITLDIVKDSKANK